MSDGGRNQMERKVEEEEEGDWMDLYAVSCGRGGGVGEGGPEESKPIRLILSIFHS